MVTGADQAGTACHHMDPTRGPIRFDPRQLSTQMLQAALLLKALRAARVPLR
jgi:hypothetical protein